MKNEAITLTKKEYDIMCIFWNETIPMSLHDITEKYPSLNKNTVQAVLKKLLNLEFIEVAEIGYSRTVLTRKYIAKLTQTAYLSQTLSKDSAFQIALNFIKNDATSEQLQTLYNALEART